MFRAGAKQVCITPPIGVELAGYGPRLNRYSQDSKDELMAQALVLDDGEARYALITCDLIALSPAFVQQIRGEVARRTQIPAAHVMIACTHSHTAPTTQLFRDWGAPDLSYVRAAGRLIAGAVVAAENWLQPATLHVARSTHTELAWNRTGSDLVDPTVEVVQVNALAGATLAVLVHYACHPVIWGPKPFISADYPGALRQSLAEAFPGAVSLFTNGACGDIDPVSNRKVWGQGTSEDVQRAGAGLALSTLTALSSATMLEQPVIKARSSTLDLPLVVPTREEINERIAHFSAEARALGNQSEAFESVTSDTKMPRFWLRYYNALKDRIESGKQPSALKADLQLFTVNDALALLAIPAEVFTEQGLAIRARSPFPHTLPVCYANGVFGYLPPKSEYAKGGYTAVLAAAVYDAPQYVEDIADRLVDAADHLLHGD
jgi:neutral ceramidase